MAVTLPSPPVESLNALNEALGRSAPGIRESIEAQAVPPRWIPHKLYTAFVQDLADSKPIIECAREAGWRYAMPQAPGDTVSAEVRPGADGQYRVDYFARGPQAAQTVELTRRIVDEPRLADDDFTLQMLVVPAVYVLALWLKNPDPARDWFVPIAPTDFRLEPGRYYDAEVFNSVLMTLAKERMQYRTPEA